MISAFIKKVLSITGYQISKVDKSNDTDHYERLYGEKSVSNKSFYNIGAGSFFHPCWTNIDHYTNNNYFKGKEQVKGINYDLFSLNPLPLPDSIANLIYTSHTIEHVNNESVQNLFNEAFRVLKKDGIFRIVTPNIDIEYRAWRENDRDYFFWLDWYSKPEDVARVKITMPLNQATTSQIFLENFAAYASGLQREGKEKISDQELKRIFDEMSYVDALNYCISKCPVELQKQNPGNHINWFNKEKLFRMLKQAGFEKIHHSAYGQSFSPVMRNLKYFDVTLPKVSLYVEAVK
ncbi:MAG TPA: methyltransferase domain-containing protein [Bacteroidia bacterium]|nr:methyltransferase domain-containing protein [Bacteroidia bacterium]